MSNPYHLGKECNDNYQPPGQPCRDIRYIHHVKQALGTTQEGFSGGPVYDPRRHVAYGTVVTGGQDDQHHAVTQFSPISIVLKSFKVSLVGGPREGDSQVRAVVSRVSGDKAVVSWTACLVVCLCFAIGTAAARPARRTSPIVRGATVDARPYGGHGAVFYQCQGVAFPRRSLFARTGAEYGRDPAASALRTHVQAGRLDFEPRHGWKLLARYADVALYGARVRHDPPDSPVTRAIRVHHDQTGWWAETAGGCAPERVIPGLDVAQWDLASGRVASRDSRTLSIQVTSTPDLCQHPTLDFDHAEVAYSAHTVSLLVFMRKLPPRPPQVGCPAIFYENRRDIRLPRPLGKRTVQDPSFYPPDIIAKLRRHRSERGAT